MEIPMTRKSYARRKRGGGCICTELESEPRIAGSAGVNRAGVKGVMFQVPRPDWPGRFEGGEGPSSLRRPHRRRVSASSGRVGDLCGGDTP